MPPKKGRKPSKPLKTDEGVAKPRVSELPTSLQISPTFQSIPSNITSAFPEFVKAQPFFSALERIIPESGSSNDAYKQCWCGISGESIVRVERDAESGFLATLHLLNGEQSVFVKRIHLLEPISAMEGEYVWPDDGALSAPSDLWQNALSKINEPMNEAYVDAIFALTASKFVESGVSPHWCKCFGTFSARAEKYVFDITDEYSSMRNRPWWRRHQRIGLFSLYKDEEEKKDDRRFSENLTDIVQDDFETLDDMKQEQEQEKVKEEETTDEDAILEEGESITLSTPKIRLNRIRAESDSDESDMCEEQTFVEFKHFPVQVTLLERAEGTVDGLIDEEDDENQTLVETKEERWLAWLFQIISALSAAQHWFGFVHNDLHTNNVMWSGTGITHLYYRIHKGKDSKDSKDITYRRIPTFGRIMKIIDFGRASFTLPEPGGFFISDAFFPGNDASNQYNCEPFYEEGKKIGPNPSFDLCRLSVSLIESLYSERPQAKKPVKIMTREGGKLYTETVSEVYNLLWEWLQDDSGKNVLRNPDGEERYPDFDLYSAIAKDVHRAVPSKQITKPVFSKFICLEKDIPKDSPIYDIYV